MSTEANAAIVSSMTTGTDYKAAHGKNQANQAAAEAAANKDVGPAATVEISEKAKENALKNGIDPEQIQKLLEDGKRQADSFTDMIRKLLEKQGEVYSGSLPETNVADFFRNMKPDQADIDKAKELVSEDGYYGVKQTSERILSLAKAFAGDDPAKIATMRKSFEKGYEEAERAWGEKLPDISKRTYDAVSAGFDEMEKNAAAKTVAA